MAKSLPRRKSLKREFTDEEMKDLKTVFDLVDNNQDGKIAVDELKLMLKKLRIDLNDEIVEELVRNGSHTGDELLDETEFFQWVKKIEEATLGQDEDDHSKDLVAAFRVFDLDQNGFITRDELRSAMEMIGETVTENQLTEFIRIADTDKDGKINYEEFAKSLS